MTYDERRGQPCALVEDVVRPGHLAVRPEVGEQREVEAVWSAKARREYTGSQEIASTSVSKVRNSASRSRMPAISPVQTPEKAYG